MIKVLSYLWQLPQNLLALGLLLRGYDDVFPYKGARVYTCSWLDGGVSLGKYILLNTPTTVDVCHEYGHCRQSRMLGPLYLLIIGLWSAIRMQFRLYKKGEYYKGFPEGWADRLGGVYVDSDGKRNANL